MNETKMFPLGIDFGNKNCRMAIMGYDGSHILQNQEGEDLTPSVVGYFKDDIIIGRLAANHVDFAPKDTIFSIKRLIGHAYSDEEVQEVKKIVHYDIVYSPDDTGEDIRVILGGKKYSPIDISSMIFSKLKKDAEMQLNTEVLDVVITVPPYFNEKQKSAVRQAGRKAGLNVQSIIDEPVAAAIACGVDKISPEETRNIIVYNLEGETFDVSVLSIAGGTFQQLDIEIDMQLGGDDFDKKIMDHVLKKIMDEYGVDGTNHNRFLITLKKECEKAKKQLSSMNKTVILIAGKLEDEEGAFIDVDVEITRESFERMIEDEIQSTIDLVHTAVENAKLNINQIDNVLLLGGSTMIPMVENALIDVFGDERILKNYDPIHCIAKGAAMFEPENKRTFQKTQENFNTVQLTQLIGSLMKQERYQEAEKLIKKYIDQDNDGQIHCYMGLLYTHQKRTDDALSEFKIVLTRDPENKTAKTLATKLLVNQANSEINNKDWDSACSALSLALELQPDNPEIRQDFIKIRNILPISNLKANRRKEAADIWEEEQRNEPKNYRVIHSLTLLYYWWAVDEEERNSNETDSSFLDSLWLKGIANLVMLINNEFFWKEWKEERERLCSKDGDVLKIQDEDLNDLRNKLPKQLEKKFRDYVDQYKMKGLDRYVKRHEQFQIALGLELKSASYLKQVIDITENDTDHHIHNICGIMMSEQLGMLSDIEELLNHASNTFSENETIERLKVYYSPLGPIHILVEKKKLEKAIFEFNALPEEIRSSKEGKSVIPIAYLKRGEEYHTMDNDINKALNYWEDGLEYAVDNDIKREYYKTISEACVEQARKLNNLEEFDDAIEILRKGEELISDRSLNDTAIKPLREYTAVIYCNRGAQHIETNLFKAEEDLKKARKYNKDYTKAKEILSMIYNNQGVDEKDVDRSIEKLEKAYNIYPTVNITNNLAMAYLNKAGKIIQYDHFSANKYVDKAVDLRPTDPEIIKMLQEILFQRRRY